MATVIQGIRAKLKPLEEIPEIMRCCPGALRSYAQWKEEIINISPKVLVGKVRCNECGRVSETRYRRAEETRGYGAYAIPVDCYDFDEGIESEARTQGGGA